MGFSPQLFLKSWFPYFNYSWHRARVRRHAKTDVHVLCLLPCSQSEFVTSHSISLKNSHNRFYIFNPSLFWICPQLISPPEKKQKTHNFVVSKEEHFQTWPNFPAHHDLMKGWSHLATPLLSCSVPDNFWVSVSTESLNNFFH